MREALSDAYYAMFNFLKTQYGGYEEMAKALDKSKAALAEPLRNCDVGTAEEQYARFVDFCWRYHTVSIGGNSSCNDCPIKGRKVCQLAWAQEPYESEVK
jgi:hypothetical protein